MCAILVERLSEKVGEPCPMKIHHLMSVLLVCSFFLEENVKFIFWCKNK